MLGRLNFRLSVNITPAIAKNPKALSEILLDAAVAASEIRAFAPLECAVRIRDSEGHLCGFWNIVDLDQEAGR